jgi:alpha-beta hydrolase superfamily lysophospholipase
MLALLLAALFSVTAPQPVTVTASDGTALACSLVEPDGAPPSGGWPAVILFHGLGQSHADMEAIAEQALAPAGFAALQCDARGTGGSGGLWGLDGPREVQDARDLFQWLAARPEISDTQIGALGISLGGGAVWNATAAGVPFKAIVPMITWTNLQTALAPGDLSKSGLVPLLAAAVPASRWDPALAAVEPSLLRGSYPTTFDQLAAARSPAAKLASITTPTLLVQGRHDFLFDLDQAVAAYRLLRGPRELYIGDLGHVPAPNPPAELPTVYGLAVRWFDRFLESSVTRAPATVMLAADPFAGAPRAYTGLPPTKTISVGLPGTTTLRGGGTVVRGARFTGGPHETFGDGTVTVHYANASGWDHLVAVVRADGVASPITEGGMRITARTGIATIPLMDESVLVPRERRVTVTVGATSDVYAAAVPSSASITIGRETLTLSVLRRAVSR